MMFWNVTVKSVKVNVVNVEYAVLNQMAANVTIFISMPGMMRLRLSQFLPVGFSSRNPGFVYCFLCREKRPRKAVVSGGKIKNEQ